ncbi:unnamed protein product [Adineta steineri]|uniref:Uncharacterized protein n=1 Tax=Adineta steineri TaxID=433720 RepID=A0A814JME3_9BILA|nr:unnamed protein product [Adineta steineri]
METINAFRFYIKDLSKQLEELCKLQKRDRADESLKVYRGYANMTTLELDQIRQNIGGLISFNGFTSTTKDYEIALGFAISKPTHESVIFQILANYNLNNVIFADITQYSEFHENEILFGLCSVFRITNCVRNENNQMSIIEMTATDEDVQNFENFGQKKAEAVIIEEGNTHLLRCINPCSRRRSIILGSTIICLFIISIAAVILSRYMPSKHQISNLYNCEGANLFLNIDKFSIISVKFNDDTNAFVSLDTSTVTHEITSINTVTTELIATASTSAAMSASPKTPSQSTAPLSEWYNTSNMNNRRSMHTASVLANGHVLIAGGDYGREMNDSELYDPLAGTWTTTGSMNNARFGHVASVLSNGKVLVIGGSRVGNNEMISLNSAELYNPSTETWTTTGNMHFTRVGHTSSILNNGKLLVIGGLGVSDGYGPSLNTSELYDPSTEIWTIPNNTGNTQRRSMHTASVLTDGQVVVAGGWVSNDVTKSVVLYDPSSESWTPTSSLNNARYSHTASILKNGKVLVTGGMGQIVLNTTELYDPSTRRWKTTGSLNNARYSHKASVLKNGKVLVTGGRSISNGDNISLNSTELYDPSTETWTVMAHMSTKRWDHTASVLLNEKVLVCGGINSDDYFSPINGELYQIP